MTSFVAPERRDRSVQNAMLRGIMFHCPACGKGAIFRKYLKVADQCSSCGEDLSQHQADDAPPYFTIFIVGHIVVPMMLWVEMSYHPPIWVHTATWPTLTLVLSLILLPIVKGAVVGLQWALRMHGFGTSEN